METRNEELYAQAKDRYMHRATEQDLREAREMFARLGDHPGARAYVERCDTLLRYQVGNTVTFGSWEGTPIRWRVLDERGKLRLLFAEDIVAERAYNDAPVDTSCGIARCASG